MKVWKQINMEDSVSYYRNIRFGQWVKWWMERQGITPEGLAQRLSWSLDRVTRLLNGQLRLDRSIKVTLAIALRVGLENKQPVDKMLSLQESFSNLTDEQLDESFRPPRLPHTHRY